MSKAALTVGLFLGLGAGAATGSAYATTLASPDPTAVPQSAIVRYHEKDLATSRGVQNLYLGIDRVARDVCDDTGEYVMRSVFAKCQQSAIANAVAQVDNAKLTQIYNEHFPRAPLSEAVSLRLQPSITVVAVG
jgi:UrcA family protein